MSQGSSDLFGSGSASPHGSSVGVARQRSQPVSDNLLSDSTEEQEQDFLISPDDGNYHCVRCKKTLKTKGGFRRHKFLHVYRDSLARISWETLKLKSRTIVEEVLIQMLNDEIVPLIAEEHEAIIRSLLSSLNLIEWVQALEILTSGCVEVLNSNSTKLLPQKQWEENLKNFHEWLTHGLDKMKDILLKIVPSSNLPVLHSIVYRFCSLYFNRVKKESLQMMRARPQNVPGKKVEITTDEKKALYYAVGSILKKVHRRNHKFPNNAVWKLRARCVKECLIFNSDVQYSEDFVAVKSWYMCDRGRLTGCNEDFFNLILYVERIVKEVCAEGISTIKDEVINRLFCIQNSEILELWYTLTCNYLTEVESIAFFGLLMEDYVRFSVSAEAELRLRLGNKPQKVALRTSLKKN